MDALIEHVARAIELTQGKFALVDAEDYDWLMQWKWCVVEGYAFRTCRDNGKKKGILMHRFIMSMPLGMQVDHANGNKLDNRRSNLRICTYAQNQQNRKKLTCGKSSQYKGVCKHKNNGWEVHIGAAGKFIYVGFYKYEIEAALAYNKAAKKYHGEFAYLNPIAIEAYERYKGKEHAPD